jgi:Holliday junction DNA helicase RuvB
VGNPNSGKSKIFIKATMARGEALDHVLLHGPPGLGKTTLSQIISNELGATLRMTSGPVLEKPGDLAGLLTNLSEGDVLFIDEIHRLNTVVEEYLYSAMEDYRIDIMIDSGPNARSIQISLKSLYLNWRNHSYGFADCPHAGEIWYQLHLDYYNVETLEKIIYRSASLLNIPISKDGALEIGKKESWHTSYCQCSAPKGSGLCSSKGDWNHRYGNCEIRIDSPQCR